MFGSGASMVFSLSKDRELVKSQERRSKARGRGRITPAKPSLVGGARMTAASRYPAPKPGSGGITVIEPLDKSGEVLPSMTAQGDSSEGAGQFESVPEADDLSGVTPGLPLRVSEDIPREVELISEEAEGEGENFSTEVEEHGEGEMLPQQRGEIVGSVAPQQGGGAGGVAPQQGGGAEGVAPQQENAAQPAAKPKRYSSQRQKTTGERVLNH